MRPIAHSLVLFCLLAACTPNEGNNPVCTSGCLIGTVCYPNGVLNPANPCQVCRAAASASTWSNNDGASCDDQLFCTTSDACTGGVCSGVARNCADAIGCNGVESCDEGAEACVAGTPTCDTNQVCELASDACVTTCTGCAIGGVCYGDGQVNPTDSCLVCTPGSSTTAWTNHDGASCDDGLFCTVADTCASGICSGGARDCADAIGCNGVESCDEGAEACVAGTPTCDADEICDTAHDACVATCTGCVIDGTCYGAGQLNPPNACLVCTPGTSASTWTNNDGASCDDGVLCTVSDTCAGGSCSGVTQACDDAVACNGVEMCDEGTGECLAGTSTCATNEICVESQDLCSCPVCLIGGVCHLGAESNLADECQVCNPASSTDGWSIHPRCGCPCFASVQVLRDNLAILNTQYTGGSTCENFTSGSLITVGFFRPGCTSSTCGGWFLTAGSYDYDDPITMQRTPRRQCAMYDCYDGPPPPTVENPDITAIQMNDCVSFLTAFATEQACPGF